MRLELRAARVWSTTVGVQKIRQVLDEIEDSLDTLKPTVSPTFSFLSLANRCAASTAKTSSYLHTRMRQSSLCSDEYSSSNCGMPRLFSCKLWPKTCSRTKASIVFLNGNEQFALHGRESRCTLQKNLSFL